MGISGHIAGGVQTAIDAMRQRRVEEEERLFREQMQQAQLALQQQAQASLEKQRALDEAYRARQEAVAGEDRAISRAETLSRRLPIGPMSEASAKVLGLSPIHADLAGQRRVIDARPIAGTAPLDTSGPQTYPVYEGTPDQQAAAFQKSELKRITDRLQNAPDEAARRRLWAEASGVGVVDQIPAHLFGATDEEKLRMQLDAEQRQLQHQIAAEKRLEARQIAAEQRANTEFRNRANDKDARDAQPYMHPQLLEYSRNTIRQIDDLIGKQDDPTTPENEATRNRITNWTAGGGGQIMRNIPFINTEAKNVSAELFSVASQVAISSLQKMRASSLTGGAIGNVALGEMKIMENAVAAIEKDQSPANLTRQLNIIRDSERNFIRAVQEDMARNMNRGITVAPGGAPGGASARPKQIRYDIDGNPIK